MFTTLKTRACYIGIWTSGAWGFMLASHMCRFEDDLLTLKCTPPLGSACNIGIWTAGAWGFMLASHMCRFEDDLLLSSSLRLTHIPRVTYSGQFVGIDLDQTLEEWSLDCRCGASKKRGQPRKKKAGSHLALGCSKDHETMLVYAGLVLGLSTHIRVFERNGSIFGLKNSRPVDLSGGGRSIVRGAL
jgi:hypothetical protein